MVRYVVWSGVARTAGVTARADSAWTPVLTRIEGAPDNEYK
jgi:hypothetical protein